jgi:perosamine synthetase
VDAERFVKLYLAGVKQAAELTKAGLTVFELIRGELRENPNTDRVNLSFYGAKLRKPGLTDRNHQRGLRELLEKHFIFRSPYGGVFFVNIQYIFNGDRLAFVKAYHLKGAKPEPRQLSLPPTDQVIQPSLPSSYHHGAMDKVPPTSVISPAFVARGAAIGTSRITGEAHMTGAHAESGRDSETTQPLIPVYRPDLSGNERRYVLDCIDSSWISSIGVYIPKFEAALAEVTGAQYAIAVCNGTVALHLALHCLGIGPGDEVIVPSFTYIASVNTIAQTGATPVFADSRAEDWMLDPAELERLVTPRTKAVLAVHLYGAACDMRAIQSFTRSRGLFLVEDAAEALGRTIHGQHVGTFGDVGTFSFFGNKTVTTGEGGAVVAMDDTLAARLRQVKGQGQSLTRRYWHEVLGFNYRMTNIAAAIGVAQFERLPAILARKHAVTERYRARLAGLPVSFQTPIDGMGGPDWLVTLLLPRGTDRERVMALMAAARVETRPVFHCAHQMPMYDRGQRLAVAEDIAARGISLPSYPTLTEREQDHVVEALAAALGSCHARASRA